MEVRDKDNWRREAEMLLMVIGARLEQLDPQDQARLLEHLVRVLSMDSLETQRFLHSDSSDDALSKAA